MRFLITFSIVISLLFSSLIFSFQTQAYNGVVAQGYKAEISAWFPYWDRRKVIHSFRKNKNKLNEISPYWYILLPNGKLRPTVKFNLKIIREAKKAKVKVIPMVSNHYNGAIVSKVINNGKRRKVHIRELVRKVTKRKLDGIELDYEGLLQKDRRKYVYFIKLLARALHKHKKILSVTLQAKTKRPGHSGSTKAQNWKAIGKYADRFKIMAYDYHWKTSPPGAIAPIRWVKRIAKFASRTLPPSKTVLGVGTYGYNWYGNKRAKPITLAQAKRIAKHYKKRIRRDRKSKELYLRLKGGRAGIWIQDSGSLRLKLKIAKKYKLRGVCFWRLGNEEQKTWKVVQQEVAIVK